MEDFGACSLSSVATNGYVYKYTSVENFTNYVQIVNSLAKYISIVRHSCKEATSTFACNAIFVPCDLTTGEPRATCSNSCYHFSTHCDLEYDTIVKGLTIIGLQQSDICADTLQHIKKVFGSNSTFTGAECKCLGK